jgi:hypothetical protein
MEKAAKSSAGLLICSKHALLVILPTYQILCSIIVTSEKRLTFGCNKYIFDLLVVNTHARERRIARSPIELRKGSRDSP